MRKSKNAVTFPWSARQSIGWLMLLGATSFCSVAWASVQPAAQLIVERQVDVGTVFMYRIDATQPITQLQLRYVTFINDEPVGGGILWRIERVNP